MGVTVYVTINGNGLKIFFPIETGMSAARLRTTVCSWRQCCIAIVRAFPGAIFLPVSATGKTFTIVYGAGAKAV